MTATMGNERKVVKQLMEMVCSSMNSGLCFTTAVQQYPQHIQAQLLVYIEHLILDWDSQMNMRNTEGPLGKKKLVGMLADAIVVEYNERESMMSSV